jgi:hypothetical protein
MKVIGKDFGISLNDRTLIVPLEYLHLAANLLATRKQNFNYWKSISKPLPPNDRVRLEEIRQIAVFSPIILVWIFFLSWSSFGVFAGLLITLPLMRILHNSLQQAILRQQNKWHDVDQGRYAFTKAICEKFSLSPEQVTLGLLLDMSEGFQIWFHAYRLVLAREKIEAFEKKKIVSDYHVISNGADEEGGGEKTCSTERTLNSFSSNEKGRTISVGVNSAVNYHPVVNPINGLPMVDYIDVEGNALGLSDQDSPWEATGAENFYSNSGIADGCGSYDWGDPYSFNNN